MPSITVKKNAGNIYSKVRRQAEAHHRSINSKIINWLGKNVRARKISPDDMLQETRQPRK